MKLFLKEWNEIWDGHQLLMEETLLTGATGYKFIKIHVPNLFDHHIYQHKRSQLTNKSHKEIKFPEV